MAAEITNDNATASAVAVGRREVAVGEVKDTHRGSDEDDVTDRVGGRSTQRKLLSKGQIDPEWAAFVPTSTAMLCVSYRLAWQRPSLATVRGEMSAGLELQDRDEVRRVDERLVLGPLFLGEKAFVCALGQEVNPCLNARVNSNLGHAPGRLVIEASAEGVQKPVDCLCGVRSAHNSYRTTTERTGTALPAMSSLADHVDDANPFRANRFGLADDA